MSVFWLWGISVKTMFPQRIKNNSNEKNSVRAGGVFFCEVGCEVGLELEDGADLAASILTIVAGIVSVYPVVHSEM